jgi:hypothetical protein
MSKAAHHESIRREDFQRIQPVDKQAMFHAPHLPSLHETQDDEADEHDENVKLQPINIQVLKELMAKKIHRAPQANKPSRSAQPPMMAPDGSAGMRSRQSSIRSVTSQKSNKSN